MARAAGPSRFSGVALHWLLGLIHLNAGDDDRALEEFERELSFGRERSPLRARVLREHLVCDWIAEAAAGPASRRPATRSAAPLNVFAIHPMARVGLAAASPSGVRGWSRRRTVDGLTGSVNDSIDAAMAGAAQLVLAGAHDDAARLLDGALAECVARQRGMDDPDRAAAERQEHGRRLGAGPGASADARELGAHPRHQGFSGNPSGHHRPLRAPSGHGGAVCVLPVLLSCSLLWPCRSLLRPGSRAAAGRERR